MSTPASTIKVCSGVRLNASQEHTIYFASRTAQESYFAGKVVRTFSAYTYLRKNWELKVEATMESARTWNYLYFTNPNGKTYYYFITNLQYVSDTTTKLTLELDVMQTYLFDYNLLPCFVEREHTESDEIGEHILDEDLELGDYIINGQQNVELGELCVLMLSTVTLDKTEFKRILATKYNGVFSGLSIYAFNVDDLLGIGSLLLDLENEGKSDAIFAIWMYPKSLVALEEGSEWDGGLTAKNVLGIQPFDLYSATPDIIDGYTPKNKKLYAHPYSLLYVTDNCGGSAVYEYEKFSDRDSVKFKVAGALSPDTGVKLYPLHYKGVATNYDEGLTTSNFPSCAWNQDVYKLWLAQNQHQMNNSTATSAFTVIGGAVAAGVSAYTGNVMGVVGGVGAMLGGASQINSVMAKKKDVSVQPPQSKGTQSTSINTVMGYQTFTMQHKTVDAYHAKIIDDYFTMFGYKVNSLKVPNRKARKNWTYTKTLGCHIAGNLCSEDALAIESIYNKGVTFWVNGDSIGDYTLDNSTL